MNDLLSKEESYNFADLTAIEDKITITISDVQEELADHREELNELGRESDTNYYELDNKIVKLNERIEEIYTILSNMTGKKLRKTQKYEDIDPLTTMEKNVFLNIYTEDQPISYRDFAKKMNMEIELAREYIISLLEKGIPIQKQYLNQRPYIYLDPKFKNLQAKKNILKIEQKILA